MLRGWPESKLLITVVRDENNEGHAVLTVRTDEGDSFSITGVVFHRELHHNPPRSIG
jgi:hypothetical protein